MCALACRHIAILERVQTVASGIIDSNAHLLSHNSLKANFKFWFRYGWVQLQKRLPVVGQLENVVTGLHMVS